MTEHKDNCWVWDSMGCSCGATTQDQTDAFMKHLRNQGEPQILTDKTCHNCSNCGWEPDNSLTCYQADVIAMRSAETGKLYPIGLDVARAAPLCGMKFHELAEKRIAVFKNLRERGIV